jgi:hypothetical protein
MNPQEAVVSLGISKKALPVLVSKSEQEERAV